jgi:hypothetical protein
MSTRLKMSLLQPQEQAEMHLQLHHHRLQLQPMPQWPPPRQWSVQALLPQLQMLLSAQSISCVP